MTTTRPPVLDDVPSARFRSPVLVDLRTAWSLERDLATTRGEPHDRDCDGQHGWMLDAGLDGPLEPLLGTDVMGVSSFYRFTTLDGRAAARLLDLLSHDDAGRRRIAEERQNDGPTLGAVLRAVAAHPDRLLAHGYVVGPGRCDERVTVEGVLVRSAEPVDVRAEHDAGCPCDQLVREAARLGVDDMLVPPHEITPWWGFGFHDGDGGREAEHWYRLWWD